MSSTIQIKDLQISVSKRSERSKVHLKNRSSEGVRRTKLTCPEIAKKREMWHLYARFVKVTSSNSLMVQPLSFIYHTGS